MAATKRDSVPEQAKKTGGRKDMKPLLLIFLTVFIDLVGFGIIIPVLPTYAQQLNASDTMVGLLVASYSFMQFLCMPFWGRLSDKVGRRPVLLVSLAASALGYLIWGFSASLPMLFASRLLAGAGNANIAVAQAYVSDVTTAENRTKGMAMVGIAFGLGFIFGPAIGGILSGYGMQTLGFVAAALSAIDLVLTFFILPEPEKRSNAGTQRYGMGPAYFFKVIGERKYLSPMAIFFFSTFAFAAMEATIVLLTAQKLNFGPRENSLMFLYIGFLICFVQGGAHSMTKRIGENKMVVAGTVITSFGLLLTPVSSNIAILGAALALLAIGSGINTPANQSILSKLADPSEVGGIMGVGQSLSTLGRIIGPALGCWLFQYLGMGSPYVVAAVAMVVAFVFALKLPKVAAPAKSARPIPTSVGS